MIKKKGKKMTSIKTNISKFAAMLAVAMLASLFCVGNAFANVYVDVTIPVPGTNTTDTVQVQLDKLGVQNSAANPVVGMFYKNNVWNALVTGTDAGQYASWDSILTEAVVVHNAKPAYVNNQTTVTAVNAAATQQELSLTATDGAYTKYYPDAVDLDGTTSTGAGFFFNKATNADTTLTSSLFDTSYVLMSGLNGANPNGVGPVFAWKYALDAAQTIVDEDEGTTYEAVGTAASRAAAAVASATAQSNPRLIMGCPIGSTTSFAMGKRYCTAVTGITLS